MKHKSLITKIGLVAVLVLGLGFYVQAQVPPAPTPTGPPTQVPIDGGVVLLAAAGAAYGAKKIYSKRKSK